MAKVKAKFEWDVSGLEETQRILNEVTPRHARNLNRATVFGVAQTARDKVKQKVKSMFPGGTGNLFKSIKAKRKKSHRDYPKARVVFTQGTNAKNDGFYWRFLEHGTINMSGKPYIEPVKEWVKANLVGVYKEACGKKYAAAIRRENKKIAKGYK